MSTVRSIRHLVRGQPRLIRPSALAPAAQCHLRAAMGLHTTARLQKIGDPQIKEDWTPEQIEKHLAKMANKKGTFENAKITRTIRDPILFEKIFHRLRDAYPAGVTIPQVTQSLCAEYNMDPNPEYNKLLRDRVRAALRAARRNKLLETLNKPNRIGHRSQKNLDTGEPFIVRLTQLGLAYQAEGKFEKLQAREGGYEVLPETLPPPEEQLWKEAYYRFNVADPKKGMYSRKEIKMMRHPSKMTKEVEAWWAKMDERRAAGELVDKDIFAEEEVEGEGEGEEGLEERREKAV